MYQEQDCDYIICAEIAEIFKKYDYTIGEARALLADLSMHIGEEQKML